MQTSQRTVELLSPAKNAEIGIAAINCGADAVYIAAEKFGAREDAGNTLPSIQRLIEHAHQYYARVYIALNTILRNNELEGALKIINQIYALGADGLIIQDVGLLELNLPPIPLIASTQMHNDSLEKILFLQNIGFKRVILPREFNLKQIEAIKAKTSIELECFVHGSLCVSYSGQCHLSYALGGRSANRGTCAQPCRHTYSLIDEDGKILAENKHLLSLKDLNRADHLKSLMEAGITSFKIEGRLKDISYVTNITSFYRQKLDKLIDGKDFIKSSSGRAIFDFTPNPYKTFNRGYTSYGLCDKENQIASVDTPKSLGEEIGIVAKTGDNYFTLSCKHDLKNGDGICFFGRNHTLKGTLVNKVKDGKIYPDKMYNLREKMPLYRNHDKAFIKMLEKSPCKRKINITFMFEEYEEGFKLTARDEDANTATFSLSTQKTKAEKKELAESAIKNQLKSLNDTIFKCVNITIRLEAIYFIPFSALNTLRRKTIENLLKEREKNQPKKSARLLVNDIPYPLKNITYLENCLNEKAKAFYNRHGAKLSEWAAESGIDMNGRRVMITKYCVKKELGLCGTDLGPLYLVDENKHKLLLKFNCKECLMEVYLAKKSE
ncbi:MAG: U32 family peptidase [Candidatus Omnitrophota bacterium]